MRTMVGRASLESRHVEIEELIDLDDVFEPLIRLWLADIGDTLEEALCQI